MWGRATQPRGGGWKRGLCSRHKGVEGVTDISDSNGVGTNSMLPRTKKWSGKIRNHRQGWGIGRGRGGRKDRGGGRSSGRKVNRTSIIESRGPSSTPVQSTGNNFKKAEKKRKNYFFQLLAAARNRDTRLLVSVVTALAEDDHHLRSEMGVGAPEALQVQDMLLRASSRCGQISLAERLFKVMVDKEQAPTQHTAGAFLHALRTAGHADRCVAVLSQLLDMGVDLGDVCLNIVIAALSQQGHFNRAMDTLRMAESKWEIRPTTWTFNTILSAAAKQGTAAGAAAVAEAHELMTLWGVAPDHVTINSQINEAIKAGRLDEAIDIFERVLKGEIDGVIPDTITFNTGISAYMARLQDGKAFSLLEEMRKRELKPRADTFNSILTGLIKMGKTKRAIEVFNDSLRLDRLTNTSPVRPSLVTYNLVLEAMRLEENKVEAQLVFKEMRDKRMKPDSYTLAAMVRLQFHQEDIYQLMETARVLRIRPSLKFFNSCIRGLGDHGDLYGACRIHDHIQAREGMRPDVFTYNSLLYALVQESWVSRVIGGESIEESPGVQVKNGQELHNPVSNASATGPNSWGRAKGMEGQGLLCQCNLALSLHGMMGAEAAMFLLQEMKKLGMGGAPDTVSYTTVMTGVMRSEDKLRVPAGILAAGGNNSPVDVGRQAKLEGRGGKVLFSKDVCKSLYLDAESRRVPINGKMCNSVMIGFGDDIEGAVSFWKQHVRPALTSRHLTPQGVLSEIPKELQEDLFAAYSGLIHVCGRARRADLAVKTVFAMRKDGLAPNSVLSNTYFKAKSETERLLGPMRTESPFRLMAILQGQMEGVLEVECGPSKRSPSVDVPFDKIRIRY
ncbi:unnamed protein product [Discosporangium mesarthrocarpum]